MASNTEQKDGGATGTAATRAADEHSSEVHPRALQLDLGRSVGAECPDRNAMFFNAMCSLAPTTLCDVFLAARQSAFASSFSSASQLKHKIAWLELSVVRACSTC